VAAWAVLEIWLLVLVAEATSGLVVLLILVAGVVLGATAVKRAGRSAWRNLTEAVAAQQQGAAPAARTREGRNGLFMLGGVLLMIPGLLSDAAALLLLAPPTRRLAGRLLDRALIHRGLPVAPFPPTPGAHGATPTDASGKVIQGEVINRDHP